MEFLKVIEERRLGKAIDRYCQVSAAGQLKGE